MTRARTISLRLGMTSQLRMTRKSMWILKPWMSSKSWNLSKVKRAPIAKLTSRSDIVDAELSKRKDYDLSRHYVPTIISVHHTMQHAAYSEAMADPSYCVTMEAADITAENIILDTRKSGEAFPNEALKGIAMIPIEMATRQRHSKTIIYDLLKRDMPIDMKEKAEAKLESHQYSWNHLVSDAKDLYHDVVEKVLQQCTQPQVLALAHVENKRGEIPLATATPLCKHEFRVMFRLFHTLEIVDQTPAYEDKESGTQIFYALRFTPPKEKNGYFTSLYKDDKSKNNLVEAWDQGHAPECKT